ncbi:MAG: hypothetical protein WCI73_01060 [Phycisphaerae bacterium]
MIEVVFIATEKFDTADGERWRSYCEWAKIPSLREVVSLDGLLCKHLITEFIDEDWAHVVNAGFRLHYFRDLDYLLHRVSGIRRRNLLGLYRNPQSHIESPPAPGEFTFLGYDLIEEATQISALVNCGGFPDAFSNDELNEYGLIGLFDRALEVQRSLLGKYPGEHHAECELYAIWRLKEASGSIL